MSQDWPKDDTVDPARHVEKVLQYLLREDESEESRSENSWRKNISEGRCNDHPESIVGQRPWGVLSTRAASEVASCKQNTGTVHFRVIEFEL